MADRPKAKQAKDRGVRNPGRRSGKAWKKGSIRNGIKGAKFNEDGASFKIMERAALRRKNHYVRPSKVTSKTFAEVVADFNDKVQEQVAS